MLSRTRLVLSQIPPNTSKTSKSDQLGLAGWRASVDNLLTSVLKTTLSSLPSSTLTSTLSSLSYVPSRNVEKASEALSISQQIANEKIKEVQKKIVEVEELREEDKVMLDQAVNDWKIAEKQKETYQSKLHTLQSTLANQTQTSTPESSTHPILGPLLLDLGYKKLYTPPISTLSSLPIWSKQRTFRPSRAHQIAQSKLKSKTGMPGIICLTEIESGGLKIVDGQHRVAALSIMESEGEKVDKVLVEGKALRGAQ
ncbi:hypothetical protein TL16_g08487 [Triparma laevis f. inornata]|uniref:Uncharacterized protein n=1 Tax=Triparma laevis f. inornata TaxID=1714386 RepID=A0A9W7AXU9_9STRA|nr:hypothetical protein TL16_g08487 [Triparma laevis f. inornata]